MAQLFSTAVTNRGIGRDAINTMGNPWFDPDNRFPEQREILTTCSSLVTIEEIIDKSTDETVRIHDNASEGEDDIIRDSSVLSDSKTCEVVRLAHFSVKEYLVSEQIRDQAAVKYAIQEIPANVYIVEACLAYLLHFDREDSLALATSVAYPLAYYAAEHWIQHVRTVGKGIGGMQTLCLELCLNSEEAYSNWVRLYSPDNWKQNNEMPTALYYASLNGAIELARLLLDSGADVNTQGGR
ncbi:hypothetical protein MMC14_006730 [Varicellaria rhodocarpa]|nr:hypothetical protein [Varicellaria rhodocarpa]